MSACMGKRKKAGGDGSHLGPSIQPGPAPPGTLPASPPAGAAPASAPGGSGRTSPEKRPWRPPPRLRSRRGKCKEVALDCGSRGGGRIQNQQVCIHLTLFPPNFNYSTVPRAKLLTKQYLCDQQCSSKQAGGREERRKDGREDRQTEGRTDRRKEGKNSVLTRYPEKKLFEKLVDIFNNFKIWTFF